MQQQASEWTRGSRCARHSAQSSMPYASWSLNKPVTCRPAPIIPISQTKLRGCITLATAEARSQSQVGVPQRPTHHRHSSYKDWKGNPKGMKERGTNILRFLVLQKDPRCEMALRREGCAGYQGHTAPPRGQRQGCGLLFGELQGGCPEGEPGLASVTGLTQPCSGAQPPSWLQPRLTPAPAREPLDHLPTTLAHVQARTPAFPSTAQSTQSMQGPTDAGSMLHSFPPINPQVDHTPCWGVSLRGPLSHVRPLSPRCHTVA